MARIEGSESVCHVMHGVEWNGLEDVECVVHHLREATCLRISDRATVFNIE